MAVGDGAVRVEPGEDEEAVAVGVVVEVLVAVVVVSVVLASGCILERKGLVSGEVRTINCTSYLL